MRLHPHVYGCFFSFLNGQFVLTKACVGVFSRSEVVSSGPHQLISETCGFFPDAEKSK